VRQLGEAVLAARSFLAEASPEEALVLHTWQQLEAALRHWLTLAFGPSAPSTPPANPREGFWK
jgi:hypothetical protein